MRDYEREQKGKCRTLRAAIVQFNNKNNKNEGARLPFPDPPPPPPPYMGLAGALPPPPPPPPAPPHSTIFTLPCRHIEGYCRGRSGGGLTQYT